MRGCLFSLLLALSTIANAGVVEMKSDAALAKTVAGDGEAVVVVIVDGSDAAGINEIGWQLYDLASRKPITANPAGHRSSAMKLTYDIKTNDRHHPTVYIGIVPAGDYVLQGHRANFAVSSFCFGAPVMHVTTGSVSYIGSFRIINMEVFPEPFQHDALAWAGDMTKARAATDAFPQLRDKLQAAPISNGATFPCSGDAMWAYRVPGAPDLPLATGSP